MNLEHISPEAHVFKDSRLVAELLNLFFVHSVFLVWDTEHLSLILPASKH